MPAYSYTAFNNSGKKEKGFLTASSERDARRAIKELNLTINLNFHLKFQGIIKKF